MEGLRVLHLSEHSSAIKQAVKYTTPPAEFLEKAKMMELYLPDRLLILLYQLWQNLGNWSLTGPNATS